MEQIVDKDKNRTSPPETSTSDEQQEISGKADSVESNKSQGTIAEADGKDITIRAKAKYDQSLLKLQIFCCIEARRHLDDARYYEQICQNVEKTSIGLVLGGGIYGIWTLLADQFSKTNSKETSGIGKQTSGNGKQTSGNGKQTSGNVEQTSGNIRQTSANGEQTGANGKQTSGSITKPSGIFKQTSAIGMKMLAGIKRKPASLTASVVGAVVPGVLQYFSQGTNTLLPSFQRRADGHIQVLFGWSGLSEKVKATRIELRSADMRLDTLCSKYLEHIKEYQALGQEIVARDSTRKEFFNSDTIYLIVKKERKYLENWPVES